MYIPNTTQGTDPYAGLAGGGGRLAQPSGFGANTGAPIGPQQSTKSDYEQQYGYSPEHIGGLYDSGLLSKNYIADKYNGPLNVGHASMPAALQQSIYMSQNFDNAGDANAWRNSGANPYADKGFNNMSAEPTAPIGPPAQSQGVSGLDVLLNALNNQQPVQQPAQQNIASQWNGINPAINQPEADNRFWDQWGA